MNAPSPIVKFLRVAALALSLGMLVWFVYRASVGRTAPSVSGKAADSSPLAVSAPSLASSSKTISQPIFSLRGSTQGEFTNYGLPIEHILATSSKSGVVFQANSKEPSPSNASPAGPSAPAAAVEPAPAKAAPQSPPSETPGPVLAPSSKSFVIDETTLFPKAAPAPDGAPSVPSPTP